MSDSHPVAAVLEVMNRVLRSALNRAGKTSGGTPESNARQRTRSTERRELHGSVEAARSVQLHGAVTFETFEQRLDEAARLVERVIDAERSWTGAFGAEDAQGGLALANSRELAFCEAFDAANDAVEHLRRVRLAVHAASEDVQENAGDAAASVDGPIGMDGFRWNGRVAESITPIPWRMLSYLWTAPDRTACFGDLADVVWRDHAPAVTSSQVGSARKALNRIFEANAMPFRVRISGDRVSLVRSP